ncbi:MAG: acid resistance serine protease MarP [Mycobacterium sp.]|nr:acid resistance serine protease MarP [Mycobacterium sp.]
MTPSQGLDIGIVVVAFLAAVSGWRSGALGSLMSFIGVVLGAAAGVLLAPHVVTHIDGTRAKTFATLFMILALVVIGVIAGSVVGGAMRGAIRHGGARFVDSLVGVVLQVAVVLLAAWLMATPLKSSTQPSLVAAVRDSKVLEQVDRVAPPWIRDVVRNRLSGLLDSSGLQIGPNPTANVDDPDASLASSAVVTALRPSVVKVRGVATGCEKVLEGSGFVVAPNRVMSNAHVVAGSASVTVESDGQVYDALVVSYDPNEDLSILEVPDLPAIPLQFAEKSAVTGTDALVLGFPGGGDFVATPARVRETIKLNGPDIYRSTTVTREVYTIKGTVRQGNSGGPLVNRSGQVLGVVFGAAVDDNDTGFVLTANEVSRQLAQVNNTEPVATGSCLPA